MAVSRLSACVAMAAAAASLPTIANRTYADYPFRFSPFSSSHTSQEDKSSDEKSDAKPAVEEPSKSGFDAEALERGAKALREINSSPNAKKVLLHFFLLNSFRFCLIVPPMAVFDEILFLLVNDVKSNFLAFYCFKLLCSFWVRSLS